MGVVKCLLDIALDADPAHDEGRQPSAWRWAAGRTRYDFSKKGLFGTFALLSEWGRCDCRA